MQILRIRIKNYNRIPASCRGVELDYTFTTPIITIIGSNGSGKSSLLHLLTPYLVRAKDLNDLGYVTMDITHKGNTYVLHIDNDTNSHSFKVNGVEENKSALYSVYKGLVGKHFADELLFKHILGLTKQTTLSGMAVNMRKKLLTTTSLVDTSLLSDIYSNVRVSVNEFKAIIKYEREKVADANLTDDPEEDDKRVNTLKAEVKALRPELDKLLKNQGNRPHRTVTTDDVLVSASTINKLMDDFLALREELDTHSDVLIKQKCLDSKPTYENVFRLQTVISHNQDLALADLGKCELELSEANTELETVADSTNQLSTADSKIQAVTDKLSKLPELKYFKGLTEDNLVKVYHGLASNIDALIHYYGALNPNVKRTYTKAKANALDLKIKDLTKRKSELHDKYAHVSYELEALSKIEDVSCPECHTVFKPNANKSLDTLVVDVKKVKAELDKVTNTLVELQDTMDGYREFEAGYVSIANFKAMPDMGPIVKHLVKLEDDLDLDYISRELGNMLLELEHNNDRVELTAELNNLTTQRKALQEVINTSTDKRIADITKQISRLKDRLHAQTEAYNRYMVHGKLVNKWMATYKQLKTLDTSLKAKMSIYEEEVKLLIANEKYLKLSTEIRLAKTELATKEQNLHRLTMLLTRVADIRKRIVIKEKELKDAIALDKDLNPVSGFIGYCIKGYLNKLIGVINSHVNNIWNSTLELQYITPDENVDYKFKTLVGDNLSSDISLTNKASQDLIDFLFRLALMELTGLVNFPIYIDELGSSFDEYHKQKIFDYIHNSLASGGRGTIFLVSHYAENYTGFSDDTNTLIVLDSTNLTLNTED